MQESASPDGPGRAGLGMKTVAERDHDTTMLPPEQQKRARLWRARVIALASMLCLAVVLSVHPIGRAHSAVADWDEPTRALFTAIEAGDLVSVQRAVLEGADLFATDDTGKTASALAEELGHFTITTFILAYSALEGPADSQRGGSSNTTQAPAAPAAPVEPELAAESVPIEEEIVSPVTDPTPDQIDIPFFERLTTLNPAPRQRPQAATRAQAEPSTSATVSGLEPGASAEAQAQQSIISAVPTPAFEPELEIVEEVPTEEAPRAQPTPDVLDGGEGTVVTMIPAPAPGDDPSVEQTPLDLPAPPAGRSVAQTTEPVLTPAPEVTEPEPAPRVVAAPQPREPSGFLSGLRRFDGGEPGTLRPEDLAQPPAGERTVADIPGPESYPAPAGQTEMVLGTPLRQRESTTDERVPEHERLRAEAIARLEREAESRLAQLEDARQIAADERQRTRQSEAFERGIANVEAEARAQERLALTGNPYPPGFVPPPDGGSSAVRFLQRLGIIPKEAPMGLAEVKEPAKTREQRIGRMGPIVQDDPAQALTPQDLRALSFIDSGYTAPPRGQNLNTDDDQSLGALQQIARLLSTPDQRFNAAGAGASAAGQFDSRFPSGQTRGPLNGFNAAPQLPQVSDLPTGPAPTEPPLPSVSAAPSLPTPAPAAPGDVPLPAAALDELFPEIAGQAPAADVVDGWGATTTDPGGDVIARESGELGSNEQDARAGLVDRLSSLFDPEAADAVGSGGPLRTVDGNPPVITEPSGTWDVVAVEPAAPPPPRMLLGGPARQYEPTGNIRNELELAIGRTVLGKAPPVQSDPTVLRKACVNKRRGSVSFCIEGADWPEAIQPLMRVDTVMYQGASMISRYDNGVATRFYALYPSENFEQIVRYFAETLGQPSSVWQRSIAPLAQPRAENPTVIWRATNPNNQAVSVLEIRQFDDTRGGFPDEQRGALMLYRSQAGPIFPHVSALELMRLRPG